MITRRGILMSFLGPAFMIPAPAALAGVDALYIGCRQASSGEFRLSAFEQTGYLRFELPLPGRGHDICFHPQERLGIVFARRPGRFALVFDYQYGNVLKEVSSQPGRHFYGHGCFGHHPDLLITTENAFESGQGVLGLRDPSDGFRHLGEISSYGIGPHDIALLPDQRTLVVANGGIRTHPDHERKKLNLDEMKPNLSLIDLHTGKLLERYDLPSVYHQLSIRHLAVAQDGRVAIAMQYEGGKRDLVPLAGLFDGSTIHLFSRSAKLAPNLRHYTSSICFSADETVIAVTSPRASKVTYWDSRSLELLSIENHLDAGGIQPLHNGFVISGKNVRYSGRDKTMSLPHDWDNHLQKL